MNLENLPDRLAQKLSVQPTRIKTEWDARLAAVLIPLFVEDGVWKLLFTRRTDHLDSHQGQVSFPGGAVDPTDASPQAAALRETEEEIGIPPEKIELLGTLDSLLTVTQFQIVPSVGIIPWPIELRVNTIEVARTFSVPLKWLSDEENVEVKFRQFRPGDPPVKVYYFKPYLEETIWGATARLTLDLISVIRGLT